MLGLEMALFQALEHRADKYRARQNDVLIRAVWRVWKAHERGKLLERVKNVRLLKQTLIIWQQQIDQRKRLEGLGLARGAFIMSESLFLACAISFSLRSSSTLASGALQRWRQVYATHQNAQDFAVHYHSVQLQFKMVLIWRLQLRAKLKLIKQAKLVEKYFIVRNAWNKWHNHLADKRREMKLKIVEKRILRSCMRGKLSNVCAFSRGQ
jgi:protein SFI1